MKDYLLGGDGNQAALSLVRNMVGRGGEQEEERKTNKKEGTTNNKKGGEQEENKKEGTTNNKKIRRKEKEDLRLKSIQVDPNVVGYEREFYLHTCAEANHGLRTLTASIRRATSARVAFNKYRNAADDKSNWNNVNAIAMEKRLHKYYLENKNDLQPYDFWQTIINSTLLMVCPDKEYDVMIGRISAFEE